MVREIVNIQIGECGNRIGSAFWRTISDEQSIDWDGTDLAINEDDFTIKYGKMFYNETKEGKYFPRAISIGLDSGKMDQIYTGKDKIIYEFTYHNNFGHLNSSNTFSKGYYQYGKEYGQTYLEYIRKEIENCDSFQGFQITHSQEGGSGSGLTSYIIDELRNEYPDVVISTNSIIPSNLVSDVMLQCYNFVLSFPHIAKSTDEVICIDNEGVYKMCLKETSQISYGDMNHHISQVLSNISFPFRCQNQLNSDLRKRIFNLIPYEKFHFLITRNAPISSRGGRPYYPYSANYLASHIFENQYLLASCDPLSSSYFGAAAYFRGYGFKPSEIETEMMKTKAIDIPNFKTSSCTKRCGREDNSATLIENTTAIKDIFNRFCPCFEKMYSRKAFVGYYTQFGLEISEFDESYQCLKNIISEYEEYEKY